MRPLRKWASVCIRALVVLWILLVVDGVVRRDPRVMLPHGYSIAATNWSEPCWLWYEPHRDDRLYTAWEAHCWETEGVPQFLLIDSFSHETMEFDSLEALETARKAKGAPPKSDCLREINGITGYARDGNIAYGTFDGGYFLLNTESDAVETYESKPEWERRILAVTNHAPSQLTDPTNFWVQHRESPILFIYAVMVVLGCWWAIFPVLNAKKAQALAAWEGR